MPKLSVCIETFWDGIPIEERIRKVRDLGYSAFEFWLWKDKDLDGIRATMMETGLDLATFVYEPNYSIVDKGDDQPFINGAVDSATTARSLDCSRLILTTGNVVPGETFEITRRRVVRRLKKMANVMEGEGVTLLVEPLNDIVDHKGYWLTKTSQAVDIVQEVRSPNIKMLDDLYHMQLTEGNLIDNLTLYAPWIGHFHVAGVPGRNELVGGELDYRSIFAAIDRTGYDGYVGLELFPTQGDEAALKQALTLGVEA